MRRTLLVSIAAFIIFCLSATGYAKDAPPAIAAGVNKRTITIGDKVRYTVSVELRRADEVRFPSFPDKKIGVLTVTDSGVIVRDVWFKRRITTGWYELVSFTTGKIEIPPIEITYIRGGTDDWMAAKTAPISLTVQSVLPRGVTIDDIKDVKGPLAYFEMPWLLILSGFITCVMIVVVVLSIRYRASRRPVKLPHETALEEIEAIKSFLAQAGEIKEAFVRISDCIRSYIERAFVVKAPEMTTEEFLTSVKVSSSMTMEQKDLLKEFLHACDLVKFAKHQPSAAEIGLVFTAAEKFIEETRAKDGPAA